MGLDFQSALVQVFCNDLPTVRKGIGLGGPRGANVARWLKRQPGSVRNILRLKNRTVTYCIQAWLRTGCVLIRQLP